MRVAVVGSSGFVGSAVTAALQARGAAVTRLKAPRLSPVQAVEARAVVERSADLISELVEVFREHDAVVNAAGDPDASSRIEPALVAANAVLPVVLARAAAKAEVGRFVHISSAVVQGRAHTLDETGAVYPFSAYSRSKALAEVLLAETGDERIVLYRPPSVHGADRRITRALTAIASSPFNSVASPGSAPTPQAHIDNVADAASFITTCDEKPPLRVMHPWEGFTTASFMELLGGRRPRLIPSRLAGVTTETLRHLGRWARPVSANARRLEMMWHGQEQSMSWLQSGGWTPPAGRESWERLAAQIRSERSR